MPAAKKKKTVKPAAKRVTKAEAAKAFKQKQQMYAILILAVGILIGSMLFIPGPNLWRAAHESLLGLFGPCAFLVPAFLLYIAWLAAFCKQPVSIPAKLLEALAFMLLICSVVQIFTSVDAKFPGFGNLYASGIALHSGGVLGAPGALMFKLFGKAGAAIIDILLLVVFFLLITRITLVQIYDAVKKAKERANEGASAWADERAKARPDAGIVVGTESAQAKKRKYNIDVELGPEAVKKPAPKNSFSDIFVKKPKPVKEDTSGLDDLVGKIAKLKEPEAAATATVAAAAATATQTVAPAATAVKDAPATAAQQTQTPSAPPEPLTPDTGEQRRLYSYPPVTLLSPADKAANVDVADELKSNAARLVDTLRSFGVETRITDISRGPTVTRYELQPSAGVKISRITSLSDDIALNLATAGVRIEAPIPNKAAVGIEVPNKTVSVVHIREIIESSAFQNAQSKLSVAMGRDIAGNPAVANIYNMPHMLIAGATGSGKSVCINSIIISLLYKASPEEVKLLMVDPKIVELGGYNGIPHLLVPVVTEPRRAAGALNWAVSEMQQRYQLFADNGVRDIKGFNILAGRRQDLQPMPQVVIIIDELADLIMAVPGEVEDAICRLAQKARAAGMHLVIATQRPSVDVITGVIKANIPSRIAFAVSSQVDSRTILDTGGAEKLLGRGDMLFWPMGAAKPTRLQGCYVSDDEVEKVIDFVKREASAEYDESVMDEIEKHTTAEKKGGATQSDSDEDPMLPSAIECVIDAGVASTSLLQRRLKLGYARAARIVDEMEAKGYVGPFEGSKPRSVLITRQQWLEMTTNGAKE